LKPKTVKIKINTELYGGIPFPDKMSVFLDGESTKFKSATPFDFEPGHYSLYLEYISPVDSLKKYASEVIDLEVISGHPIDTTVIITER